MAAQFDYHTGNTGKSDRKYWKRDKRRTSKDQRHGKCRVLTQVEIERIISA